MNIKRYQARDMREALRRIREDQGPEAVILSTRKTDSGLEVISAVDFDQSLVDTAVGGRAEKRVENAGSNAGRHPPAEAPGEHSREGAGFLQRFGYGRKDSVKGATGVALDADSAPPDPETPDPEPDQVSISATARSAATSTGEGRVTGKRAASDDLQSPEDRTMRLEINALRKMLESQLTALAWHDFTRESPARGALLRDLIELGLGREKSRKLAAEVTTKPHDLSHGWCQALGIISQRIAVTDTDPVERGGVIALVGPTGAGKTTTAAKLAARHAMLHGPEQVAMISADDFRVGSQEQLFAWGRMLNVPVFGASSHEELSQRIQRLDKNRLILVDTAGVGRDDRLLDRVRTLVSRDGRGMRSLLVLPANAQRESLAGMVQNFRPCNLAGLVITKLDEAASLGGLLDTLLDCGWPVAYTCDGQDVPENLRRASARNLVRRAADLKRNAESGAEKGDEEASSPQIYKEYAFG